MVVHAAAPRRRLRVLAQHARAAPSAGVQPTISGDDSRQFSAAEIGRLCDAYVRDGFVLVRGLVPASATTAAVTALWRRMEAEEGLRPDAPESWEIGQWSDRVDDPAVLGCWSDGYMAVAAALSAAMEAEARDRTHPALPSEDVLVLPHETMAINRFPEKRTAEWEWPNAHIDHGQCVTSVPALGGL
jgi:hypothetical protein